MYGRDVKDLKVDRARIGEGNALAHDGDLILDYLVFESPAPAKQTEELFEALYGVTIKQAGILYSRRKTHLIPSRNEVIRQD